MGEVVPFHARYQYPTQANRTWKSNIKIPPKNGGQPFKSGYQSAPIRIEFPAQVFILCGDFIWWFYFNDYFVV